MMLFQLYFNTFKHDVLSTVTNLAIPLGSSLALSTLPSSSQATRLEGRPPKVAAARGNVYAHKIAILVYWENDSIGAKDNTETMRTVLKGLGIKSTVQILQTTDPIGARFWRPLALW